MTYFVINYSFIKVVIIVLIDVFILVTPIFLIEFHKKHPFFSKKYIKKIVLLWYIVLFLIICIVCYK